MNEKGYETLKTLAKDLIWSWNRRTWKVWEELDSDLWNKTHNPWIVLETVSRVTLDKKLNDPQFCQMVQGFLETTDKELKSESWFQKNHPKALNCVAYFSMEYMLSESQPIYSGGLGNVAGDQLKSASDLDVPVTAIGLLYQQGYFRQLIDREGNQIALYPYNNPGQLPITPVRKKDGELLRIEIHFPGGPLLLGAWHVKVGRRNLYLLDSNLLENTPTHRSITSELYGGSHELRIAQEIVLGIGGWRLLKTLDLEPEVCHLNEGHAAFATLERAKCFMKEKDVDFNAALIATRAGNLFTTHTAVSAGFDRFDPSLVQQFFNDYAINELGISFNQLLSLGQANPGDPFNMACLAVRGCGAINAVSQLHALVSKHLFEPLFPRWPDDEIPIGYITNGVHMPTWQSYPAEKLWTSACGENIWLGDFQKIENKVGMISDEEIWNMRNEMRSILVKLTRERLKLQFESAGENKELIEVAKGILDPNTLTLGFARRFAAYKRPNILLKDPQRLIQILNNAKKPVQIIIAGKAHPADEQGIALIKEWIQFIKRPEVNHRVVFIADYDMLVTQLLVRCVDVWVNMPERPWEACGTSGMKVLPNGGINLSELDGWWAEAYSPEVGFAMGDGKEHHGDESWSAVEANALYEKLEKEVIPEFYERDEKGMPRRWLKRIRESMSRLTPHFSANRAVREYTEKYYIPLKEAYQRRENRSLLNKILQWKESILNGWSGLKIEEIKVQTHEGKHFFEVSLHLNGIDPKNIELELYAYGPNSSAPIIQKMERDKANPSLYKATVFATVDPSLFTPRVIPIGENISLPLESPEILWQR